MIEDKNLSLKIAENKVEALWTRVKQNAQLALDECENQRIVNQELLLLAERKLKEEERQRDK